MTQKLADLLNVIFGFRKFLLLLILYLVGILFRVENLISGTDMVDLFKNTTVAFMASNGVEHIMSTVKEYVNSKGQVQAVQAVPAPSGDDLIEGDDTPKASEPVKGV